MISEYADHPAGEHHVFRFNNPEEVRKKRDRATAKSSLHISVSAADLAAASSGSPGPGDSPTSSDGPGDVDWKFAKREAQLARLGLDPALDNLPDEDINKLYEKITKVKSLRDTKSRPESRMSTSITDDLWSESGRLLPSDTLTDDTSVDAWAGMPSQGFTSPSETPLRELHMPLESLDPIEESSEADDLKEEKEHMERQMKIVKAQMKRLLDARARGEPTEEMEVVEPVIYTAKQLRLIKKVLDRWRAHRSFSMAETVLSNAVVIKEATIISKELGKDVMYNFTIASGGSLAAPTSAVDTIAGLGEFGDVADKALASITQPAVAVKVLDKRHNAIYVWSLDRLQQQLQRMRNLTAFIDRPSYSRHFSSEEPFYDDPPPEYSFIGNALVSLAPLSRKLSCTSTVPIFCRYTAEAIGSCRVDLKLVNVMPSTRRAQSSNAVTRASSPTPTILAAGSKLTFFLTIDSVKGLSSHDFSVVHLQVRLSSFVGPTLTTEEVFPTSTLDMDLSTLSELKFRRSFSIVATAKVLNHLRHGYAPIEFFATLRPTYIERMERWDEMRDHRAPPPREPTPTSTPVARHPSLPPMRRSETDFVVEQLHDVVAWFEICELGPEGEYAPVPVVSQGDLDPGACMLHQGLQRRVVLTLSSTSGRQLPWVEVTKLRLGNIRLLDAKGRVHESTSRSLVTLPLQQQQNVNFRPDGTGFLAATALWDSSVHDSSLLNRVTAANQRILLAVSFAVAVETCAEPIEFYMDVAVTMQTRDARPPSKFMNFLGSSRVLKKTSTVFSVKLTPPLTRSAKELWRLDTAEKYVRGEETLGSWKPRGLTVVEDYNRLIRTEQRAADVQAIRAVLAVHPPKTKSADAETWDKDAVLSNAVDLWKKKFGHDGQVDGISQSQSG
jgi:kinesin family protein 1